MLEYDIKHLNPCHNYRCNGRDFKMLPKPKTHSVAQASLCGLTKRENKAMVQPIKWVLNLLENVKRINNSNNPSPKLCSSKRGPTLGGEC